MNDFEGLLATDYGFKPQGKSAPMSSSSSSSSSANRSSSRVSNPLSSDYDSIFRSTNPKSSHDLEGFDNVFGGPHKFTATSSEGRDSGFDFDSMFDAKKGSNLPKFDKPLYDDDIFDGVPGLKMKSSSSDSNSKGNGAFDDLLENLSGPKSKSKSSGSDNFDELLTGFGGSSPGNHRQTSEPSRPSKPTAEATRTSSNIMEDPFVVIESVSPPKASDPLDEIGKFSTNFDASTDKGRVVDDMDPLGSFGQSIPAFSSSTSGRKTVDSKDSPDRSSVKSPDIQSENKRTGYNYPESPQTMSDTATFSNSYFDSVDQMGSPPYPHNVIDSQVDESPTFDANIKSSDDVWLTVSEIPLFTQPTRAPPPSRPPPPRPAKVSKSKMSSFDNRNAKKKVNEYSSYPNSNQYFESSNIDQLENFAMGRNQTNMKENVDIFSDQEVETNSDAAASAAAMKNAMDRAEAKFRHAKEVKERENAKAARSRETVQLEKDEKTTDDPEKVEYERLREERRIKENIERTWKLERESEEKEREQRKLEKERERAREIEREREKARQAVERATREARDRAAAEARLKAEKAAVGKVNAEARQRAERAAVQRVQAEARERAAAEAKERAEKAASEAKEKAVRAELDARSRAERAAVERAAAEARQRASADARERAAAAAASVKVNHQNNEDDLESFFSMGSRPSSAPKARANSSDPLFDTSSQTRQGPEVGKRTSVGTSSGLKKASSTTNINDDLSSIFGAAQSSSDFKEMQGETEERRRARLERHQRTQERAAKALDEKNQRDLQVQRDQAERNRMAETLDAEIKRWSAGKEGNLRALLSTLQYVLWPECGWQPVSLTDLIVGASVKKVYRKATLCIHPDKVQQKGANLQQKYVAEKVFDLLKEAWNKFNSEELF